MTTIRLKFRPSTIEGRQGTLYYQICHNRTVRQISTDMHIPPHQWNAGAMELDTSADNSGILPHYRLTIRRDMQLLRTIIEDMETFGSSYSADDIVNEYNNRRGNVYSLKYIEQETSILILEGRFGTARNRTRARNSFAAFLGGKDILLAEWNRTLINEYSSWLRRRSLTRNTISFYMRILRTVYNKAVKEGIISQTYPFQDAYTGVDRTRKRAVGEDVIIRLCMLDLDGSPSLDLARDMFIFSYCTRGMAFVDMAYLRHCDIRDGSIRYCRRKTGQRLSIRIEPCIERILHKYSGAGDGTPYVFPILRTSDRKDAFRQYQTALGYYNRKLKRLSSMLGLDTALSSYTARHTWATAARNRNTPLSVISSGMGHTSQKTTEIYLASLDESVIDRVNSDLIAPLNLMTIQTQISKE